MNKEQYLNAVASWKTFIKDGKHKKYKVNCYWNEWNWGSKKHLEVCGYRWQSDLTVHHHFFYGLLRNRSLLKGFKNNDTLELLTNTFHCVALSASGQGGGWSKNGALTFIENVLKPFDGHITVEDFIEIVGKIQ